MNGKNVKYFALGAAIVAAGLGALAVNIPNSFSAGQVISAAQLNANFTAVKTAVDALEATLPDKQNRVTGACTGSSAAQTINADGTVVCTPRGAQGQIREDGSIRSSSSNVSAVNRVSAGVYCITFSTPFTQLQLESAVVGLAGSGSSNLTVRNTNGQNSAVGVCTGGLGVLVFNASGIATDGRFSFQVSPY